MALGTLVNFGAPAAALLLGGPYWGVIAFLAIALVRIALDAQAVRRENEMLHERVLDLESGFDVDSTADLEGDAPPESETRPSRSWLEKRAS